MSSELGQDEVNRTNSLVTIANERVVTATRSLEVASNTQVQLTDQQFSSLQQEVCRSLCKFCSHDHSDFHVVLTLLCSLSRWFYFPFGSLRTFWEPYILYTAIIAHTSAFIHLWSLKLGAVQLGSP